MSRLEQAIKSLEAAAENLEATTQALLFMTNSDDSGSKEEGKTKKRKVDDSREDDYEKKKAKWAAMGRELATTRWAAKTNKKKETSEKKEAHKKSERSEKNEKNTADVKKAGSGTNNNSVEKQIRRVWPFKTVVGGTGWSKQEFIKLFALLRLLRPPNNRLVLRSLAQRRGTIITKYHLHLIEKLLTCDGVLRDNDSSSQKEKWSLEQYVSECQDDTKMPRWYKVRVLPENVRLLGWTAGVRGGFQFVNKN